MAETKNREKTLLNECMVKIINGTRYKVYSVERRIVIGTNSELFYHAINT